MDELSRIKVSLIKEIALSNQRNLKLEKTEFMLKQAEDNLRKNEDWHRTILQTAMDGFWRADVQGRLLEVNETYCRMSGYSKSELMSMCISDLEVVEPMKETLSHINNITEKGEDRFETKHRRKDGNIFDVEVSVQYRPDSGVGLVA